MFRNLTSKDITLLDGTILESETIIPKLTKEFNDYNHETLLTTVKSIMLDDVPEPESGVIIIVNANIKPYLSGRTDVAIIDECHPDIFYDEEGNILKVPCFVV